MSQKSGRESLASRSFSAAPVAKGRLFEFSQRGPSAFRFPVAELDSACLALVDAAGDLSYPSSETSSLKVLSPA